MVPLAIVSVLWGPRNGTILGRFGSRIPLIIAGVGFVLAALILTEVTTSTPVVWLLIAYALIGLADSPGRGSDHPPRGRRHARR